MSDFSKILLQQCNVELQTKFQISVKSVNACNSYSQLSDVTPKTEVSTIGNQTTCDCQSVRLYKYQTHLKSMFKMSSVCSNAS